MTRSLERLVLLFALQSLCVASFEAGQDPGAAAIDAAVDSCIARATGVQFKPPVSHFRRASARKTRQAAQGQDPISRFRNFIGHFGTKSADIDVIDTRRKVILQLQSQLHRDRTHIPDSSAATGSSGQQGGTAVTQRPFISSGHSHAHLLSCQEDDDSVAPSPRYGALPSVVTWASQSRACDIQQTLDEEQAHDEAHTEAETNPLETETNEDAHAEEGTDPQLHASDYSIHHSPVSSASASLQDDRTRLESKIEKIATELKSPDVSEAKQFALKKKMAMCRADLIKLERRIDVEKAQQVCTQAFAVWRLGFRVDVEKAEKAYAKALAVALLCSCDARDQITLMSVENRIHPAARCYHPQIVKSI